MASLVITTRRTKSGPRYVVRYRLGGRAYPIVHAGSFRTLREARVRRDLVGGEIAAGRNPADALRAMTQKPVVRTFAEWADAYRTSRVDLASETTKNLVSHLKAMTAFDDCDPASITPADVQQWIGGLTLKPASMRRYLATLRAVLDFAGIDSNPARSEHVRLPREERTVVDPPTAADVDAIIATVPSCWRLALRTLEQTGMRVGEAGAWSGATSTKRARVSELRTGRPRSPRRWVAVPEWLMVEIAATCPREDRTAERRVFLGFTPAWRRT